MKKILAIIGSPRKLGNSEIMAKEISRNISVPHELRLLRLSDFNIQPCRACYFCLFKNEKCVIQDDFNTIANALTEADAFILTAPTYFLGPNASLKRFLDRGLALYSLADQLWGKPAVCVGIAGIEGKEGYTLLGIESFLKLLLCDIRASRMIYGALPGEIFLNEAHKKTAAEMGAALFGPPLEDEIPSCPLCGGKTFRFLGENRVRCMLCSNTGTVRLNENRPVFSITGGEHELLLTAEDAKNHREWLKGMKSRFLEHKGELKKVTLDYRGGEWIKPAASSNPDS